MRAGVSGVRVGVSVAVRVGVSIGVLAYRLLYAQYRRASRCNQLQCVLQLPRRSCVFAGTGVAVATAGAYAQVTFAVGVLVMVGVLLLLQEHYAPGVLLAVERLFLSPWALQDELNPMVSVFVTTGAVRLAIPRRSAQPVTPTIQELVESLALELAVLAAVVAGSVGIIAVWFAILCPQLFTARAYHRWACQYQGYEAVPLISALPEAHGPADVAATVPIEHQSRIPRWTAPL